MLVTEIVKHDPSTSLYYSVGDEYEPPGGVRLRETTGSDGQVIFMTGSPAEMRFSCSYSKGRVTGLADMPLTKLRELASAK